MGAERAVGSRTQEALDRVVADLAAHKHDWARLAIPDKLVYLRGLRDRTQAVAEQWAQAGASAKRIPANSPLVGEEWMSGPWGLLYGINGFLDSLREIQEHGAATLEHVRTRPDGQVVVRVFPATLLDRLLLSGYVGEVWMQPEITPENLRESMAQFYRQPDPPGRVALVLGAGNISSIAPLDLLYKLFAEGQVCLLKTHPVKDYVRPFLERIFEELVEAGYVRITAGGIEAGSYLVDHPQVDEIHLTGSWKTYEALVFGPGAEGQARKRRGERLNSKRVTAELGCVTPTIVLPGPWSRRDLRYQAEHIATQKSHNAGFNCIAAQVLVLPEAWDQADELTDQIRAVYQQVEPRHPYYPGADQRLRSALAGHEGAQPLGDERTARALIEDLDPEAADEPTYREEVFAELLSTTRLPGDSADSFLKHAVRFCNEVLWGSLGANLIVHPRTMAELGRALDDAIAELRYGSVGVNVWTGGCFLVPQLSWGAYPGHTPRDIQSGTGVVHNSLMFGKPEKSVVRGPFYPFPRNLLHGEFHFSPKPPWFVTHRNAAEVGRRLVDFEANRSLKRLPGLFLAALRA